MPNLTPNHQPIHHQSNPLTHPLLHDLLGLLVVVLLNPTEGTLAGRETVHPHQPRGELSVQLRQLLVECLVEFVEVLLHVQHWVLRVHRLGFPGERSHFHQELTHVAQHLRVPLQERNPLLQRPKVLPELPILIARVQPPTQGINTQRLEYLVTLKYLLTGTDHLIEGIQTVLEVGVEEGMEFFVVLYWGYLGVLLLLVIPILLQHSLQTLGREHSLIQPNQDLL